MFLLVAAGLLSGCIVTAPARTLYSGAKIAGKTVYYTGVGAYRVGRLSVRVADGVLDGTEEVLKLTVRMATATGEVAVMSYEISAISLDSELSDLERNERVLEVLIERLDAAQP